jgi:hypothetical protein
MKSQNWHSRESLGVHRATFSEMLKPGKKQLLQEAQKAEEDTRYR